MSSETPARIESDWPAIWLTVAVAVVAAMQLGKVPPAIPVLRGDLGLSLVAAGWLASLVHLIGAGIGVAAGSLADQFGRRRLVSLGLALMALGSLAGALAGNGSGLLAARAIEGLGFAAMAAGGPSLIFELSSGRDRALALGAWGAFFPAGMALGLALSPLLLPHGWQLLWAVNGALLCAAALSFSLGTRRLTLVRPGGSAARMAARVGAAARRPGPWLLGLCFVAYSCQWVALMAWLPTVLMEAGYDGKSAALLVTLVVAVNIPGNLAAGWLLQRGLRPATLILATFAAMMASGWAMFALGLAPPLQLALALLFSTVGGIIPAAIFAAAPRHSTRPDAIGVVNGFIIQGSNLGSLIGPPALALVGTMVGGWQASGSYVVVAGTLGMALALALAAAERR